MARNKRVPSQSTFQQPWLSTPGLREWVQKVPNNQRAKCILCSKVIDITNVGQQALVSHMKSQKCTTSIAAQKKTMDIIALVSEKNKITQAMSLDELTASQLNKPIPPTPATSITASNSLLGTTNKILQNHFATPTVVSNLTTVKQYP